MKKIIHLSDLHVGHELCGDNFNTIIERIKYLNQPPDNYVIVITGDIVDNANKTKQIDEAVVSIGQLRESGYNVLVVPGNHDYGTGVLGDEKFVEVFKERYFKSTEVSYPKLDIIDEIAFIGLDSTAEELNWCDRFLSEGELGEEQLTRLKSILNEPEVAYRKKVLYLHHHPFDFKVGMQLKDNGALKKIIENKIDVLLFGHYHVDYDSVCKSYNGTWGIPRCYNAGSSTHKDGDAGFQRVIDLSDADTSKDYNGNYF